MHATAAKPELARTLGDDGDRPNEFGEAAVEQRDRQIVTLTLNRFAGPRAVAWMISQMQLSKPKLRDVPGLDFHKLMGTGGGAGFSTRPNLNVWTLLATWPTGRAALAGTNSRPWVEREDRAEETVTVFLAPISSRGRWAGTTAFEPSSDIGHREGAPIAALTRATVRPSMLARFWRRVPSISRTIESEADVRFMIGMGEVPYLHQVTFSIWDSAEAMQRFSRDSATHGEAVRRVANERWFSEQLFARFRPIHATGRWNGAPASSLLERR